VQRHVGDAGVDRLPVHLAVVVEVVSDVHVGVDVARQHRHGRQVVDAVSPGGPTWHDLGDPSVAHY